MVRHSISAGIFLRCGFEHLVDRARAKVLTRPSSAALFRCAFGSITRALMLQMNMRELPMASELRKVESLFAELVGGELCVFPEHRQPLNAPDTLGVYIIYSPRGRVLHVGRTPRAKGGLAQRLRNHMYGSSSFKYYYLDGDGSKLRGKYKFRYVEVSDGRIRALLEAYAVGHLCPAHLGLGSAPA